MTPHVRTLGPKDLPEFFFDAFAVLVAPFSSDMCFLVLPWGGKLGDAI
jgi:hypothetical protein